MANPDLISLVPAMRISHFHREDVQTSPVFVFLVYLYSCWSVRVNDFSNEIILHSSIIIRPHAEDERDIHERDWNCLWNNQCLLRLDGLKSQSLYTLFTETAALLFELIVFHSCLLLCCQLFQIIPPYRWEMRVGCFSCQSGSLILSKSFTDRIFCNVN